MSISTNHFTLFGVLAATDASATSGTTTTTTSTTTTAAAAGASSPGEAKAMVSKTVGSIIEGCWLNGNYTGKNFEDFKRK